MFFHVGYVFSMSCEFPFDSPGLLNPEPRVDPLRTPSSMLQWSFNSRLVVSSRRHELLDQFECSCAVTWRRLTGFRVYVGVI